MVLAIDPAAAERWYRTGVRERNVTAVMGHDGTVTMSANGLPADDAEAACIRVQDLAAAAKRAGHPGLIGQIRCDLFLGLLDGRFHGMTADQLLATLIAQYRPDGPGTPAGRPDSGNAPHHRPADEQHNGNAPSADRPTTTPAGVATPFAGTPTATPDAASAAVAPMSGEASGTVAARDWSDGATAGGGGGALAVVVVARYGGWNCGGREWGRHRDPRRVVHPARSRRAAR